MRVLYHDTKIEIGLFATRVAVRVLGWMRGGDRRIRSLPMGAGWTISRDFPAPSGRTLRELYAARGLRRQQPTRA